MKRISGGQTSVGADAKLLSSHAGDPRAATGDTTDTSHTGQRNSGRSAASYGVSPLPARGSTGRVGRHRPSARTLTQRPVIRDRQPGGASHHVPVSCCLTCPALGLSSSFGLPREESPAVPGWCVGALDGIGVRAGAQPYFGPRPCRAAGRRQDVRWGDPAGGSVAAAQSFEAVHANVSAATVREPAAAHRCE